MTSTPRFGLLLLAAAACVALPRAIPAEPASPHVVVLADGRLVGARTRPAIAFGQVSFVDDHGALVTLRSSEVNVEATRSRLPATTTTRVWNEQVLAKANFGRAVVNVAGDGTPGGPEGQEGAPPPVLVPSDAGSQRRQMQAEIDRLDTQVAGLSASDRQVTLIRQRQRELRDEMAALPQPAPRRD